MKTLYAGIDVSSGLRFRYRVEEKKITRFFMGVQHFLPHELTEAANITIKNIKIKSRGLDPILSETLTLEYQQEKLVTTFLSPAYI